MYDVQPTPFRDWLEIGYAAKLKNKLIEDEGWTVERILRRGAFARNGLLTDEAILDELQGVTGSSGQRFKRKVSLSNPAHVASAKKDLREALASNPSWLAQIYRSIDDASVKHPDCFIDINVYCPSAGVFTLYLMATSEDSSEYMPYYAMRLLDSTGNQVSLYIGLLTEVGDPVSLNGILAKYYEGSMEGLMLLACFGFYETRDAEILEDLGLAYRTVRVDGEDRSGEWFELKDERWRSFNPDLPLQPLQGYFDKNQALIHSIVVAIGSRMHGGVHRIT